MEKELDNAVGERINVEAEEEEELLSNYEKLVKKIAGEQLALINDTAIEYDDLYQEGMIALYLSYGNYKELGPAKFSTYAYISIKRRIKRFISWQRNIYLYEKQAYDLENIEDDEYELKIQKEERNKLVDEFIKKLSKKDAQIMTLYLKNHSYGEIAHILNLTCRNVEYRMSEIKKELYIYIRKN